MSNADFRAPTEPGQIALAAAWTGSHGPQDGADGLRNRSVSREKPVTQSSVTGSELRKLVAGDGFEPS
jgi:hypothetical protein